MGIFSPWSNGKKGFLVFFISLVPFVSGTDNSKWNSVFIIYLSVAQMCVLWRVSRVASVCWFLVAESCCWKECWPQAAPSSPRSQAPCSSDSSDTVTPFLRKRVEPTAQHFSVCLQGDFLIKVHSDCAWEWCVLCQRSLSLRALTSHLPGEWVGRLFHVWPLLDTLMWNQYPSPEGGSRWSKLLCPASSHMTGHVQSRTLFGAWTEVFLLGLSDRVGWQGWWGWGIE